MRVRRFAARAFIMGVFVWLSAGRAEYAIAHCDTLDGPVVQAARVALESGDVTPVLMWVRKEDEQKIRDAYEAATLVREEGEAARELADRYFFETLVRIHRAGEGAPYTGLKPAGHVDEPIAAADEALEEGSVEQLADRTSQAVREAIVTRFSLASEGRKHAEESVEAGRDFVEAYVDYVHFVEALHKLLSRGSAHGQPEDAGQEGHDH